ncbi:hypothetical protein KOR34_07630 [Posidoniimonas corsicana]|uniref:Uncharacterized protein n=2 Tax=Posidoniimonas corsicana TaxID=1938618 RepID=A0A5C5VD40_9BACT|nr:hypothetical protein KOR34_07630 [Posidoniimonas corsicana]
MAALEDIAEVETAFTRCISILEMLIDRCDRVEHYLAKGVEFEDAEPPFRYPVRAIWPSREKKLRDSCRLLDADLYASLLLELLQKLSDAVHRAQVALDALSEDICTTLSKVGPDPWRPTVRRSTLDKLIFWPIDPHCRVRIPDCWREWETLTRQSDPRPAWIALRTQLESFRSDAVSIRGEVDSEVHKVEAPVFAGSGVVSGDEPADLKWDSDKGELRYSGQLIRTAKRRNTNIRRVLDAFEEQGWPTRIDDPLPGGQDSSRVKETCDSLRNGLSVIDFRPDGGDGFRWELVKAEIA